MDKITSKEFFNNPKYIGIVLILAFFIAFLLSDITNQYTLPVFVICTISMILSVAANVWDYTFLNSIVIGYWGIYLITIIDIMFASPVILIHLVNLILATMVLVKRWRNTWSWLIFLSGFLWVTVIGTEKQVTNGASEYFRMFDWRLQILLVSFNLFIALIIWLAQNPKKQGKKLTKNKPGSLDKIGTKTNRHKK